MRVFFTHVRGFLVKRFTQEKDTMAKKRVGELIKEARTSAGMTQEQLARKVKETSAQDISKAERGELELNKEQLKAIAKATGVTQKSLLDAAAGKSLMVKPAAAKKTSSGTSLRLSANEKKLVELYRAAKPDQRNYAVAVLKGKVPTLMQNIGGIMDIL